MLLTKSKLHRLVDFLQPDRIAREVVEKLDLLAILIEHAGSIEDES